METIECEGWEEFRGHILRYSSLPRAQRDAFIFRGHADSDWKLQSTLDRRFSSLAPTKRADKLERLLAEFSSELYGIEDQSLIEATERLELLGRHHGLPTTVLDWSRSPYVAAYFAFEGDRVPASGKVAIWCYDRRELGASPAPDEILIDDLALVGDNVRALQQRAVFVRLPVGELGEDVLSAGLWKYTLPYSSRTIAISELDEMLINARSLFRDRDAAARTALIRESLP